MCKRTSCPSIVTLALLLFLCSRPGPCDRWNVTIQTWFFVRICLYESKGDQKFCILGAKGLLSGYPYWNPYGRHMYVITKKAILINLIILILLMILIILIILIIYIILIISIILIIMIIFITLIISIILMSLRSWKDLMSPWYLVISDYDN